MQCWDEPNQEKPEVMEALKQHWARLSTLPSTNWQIFVASILGAVTVLTVNGMMIFSVDVQEEVLYPLFGFITTLGGIGVYQFKKKRETSPEHFEGVAKVEAAKTATGTGA